ncbi:TnsD family Tn7-like transposition protein [Paenibacillus sp. MCAF9]|uniref:TnsD family Tn7-like transposition protein n=1 Tax=Paenibacillus sp. MCAF9 TaxID=3233046 RepID=UPI003F95A113
MILLLAHFPTLFEDELLYSGIARYHLNSGNRTQRQTIEDLFGDRLVCATVDLPSHLEGLARRLHNRYSVDQLVQNHTLFPYYSYYLNNDKCTQVKSLMTQGTFTGVVHASLGLLAGRIKSPTHIKYCPVCFKEESVKCEPYWHRSHQLPGVVLCEIHKVPLLKSNIIYSTRDHKFAFIPISQIGEEQYRNIKTDPAWEEHLQLIAEQSAQILNSSSKQNIPTYKISFHEKGYQTIGNRIRIDKLIRDFREFFTDELLNYLHCDIDPTGNDTWLHKLVRGNVEITQPLRHILLGRFLGQSIEMVSSSKQIHPFGEGPWPCLNKVADHYKTYVIEKCVITRCSKTSLPVGTFVCSCGFVYSRRGPDKCLDDKYKVGRIKSFGSIWYEKLKVLNSSSQSLRAKAGILGVDPNTVKKQSELFQKPTEKKKLIGRAPVILKKEIRHRTQDYSAMRVNWGQRDEILSVEVGKVIQLIRTLDDPMRITVSSIARYITVSELSFKILKESLEKLPKTKELINAAVELTEDFQIRRLIWAADKLKESELTVGWKLLKLAGLNNPLRKSVQDKFNELTS